MTVINNNNKKEAFYKQVNCNDHLRAGNRKVLVVFNLVKC